MNKKTYLFFFNLTKNDIEPPKQELINYKKYKPEIITNGVNHQSKTTCNICWWCDLKIDSIPIHIPYSEDIDKKSSYACYGYFCSYQCAMAYNKYFGINKEKSNYFLKYMYHKEFNDTYELQEAPNKTIMSKYGGVLSEEKYKELLDNKWLATHKFMICGKPFIVDQLNITKIDI